VRSDTTLTTFAPSASALTHHNSGTQVYSEYIQNYPESMSVTVEKFQSSELSRNSAKVFAVAENAAVLITRRDGEDLVLMPERDSHGRRDFYEFASLIMSALFDDRGTLVERMIDRFPWISTFKPDGREECVNALVDAARTAFATNSPRVAMMTLIPWRETAFAIAEGLSPVSDDDVYDEPIIVPNPALDV